MSPEKQNMIGQDSALIGRATPIIPSQPHAVNSTLLNDDKPQGYETIIVGMGCFWGAERLYWKQKGIYSTAVGYSGGFTPNPTYDEICTGKTGHTEVVRIIYDPVKITQAQLLALFWENHDPTQGMRQGNDTGSQYRSVIYVSTPELLAHANISKECYQQALQQQTNSPITTEIELAGTFYFAEDYHQQYLSKNPDGYCGLGGTGICFPPQ